MGYCEYEKKSLPLPRKFYKYHETNNFFFTFDYRVREYVRGAELESTDMSGVTSDKGVYTRKVLQKGQILIIRNGICYDMMGNLIQ